MCWRMLSIVIPVLNHSDLTRQVILNIQDVCKDIDHEIVVVDDGSTDDTQEVLKELQKWILRVKRFVNNRWVTQARNHWVMLSQWDIICVINNDIVIPQWFFERMMEGLTKDVVMVSPRFTQSTNPNVAFFRNKICGFCFMFRKEDKYKFFPVPEKLKVFSNDNRISNRIQIQGLNQKVVHDAIIHHLQSRTVKDFVNTDRPVYEDMCKENGRDVIPLLPYSFEPLDHDYIF